MKKPSDWLAPRIAAVAVAAIVGAFAVSYAQFPSNIIASPTGLEQIEVIPQSAAGAVTSPQKAEVTINQIRNAAGYLTQAAGTTINTTVPNTASKVMATGAITTWNVTLPIAPFDGQMVEVACPGGTATVSVAATSPPSVAIVGTAFTACTSGGAAANTAEWIYSVAANTWYRIQ